MKLFFKKMSLILAVALISCTACSDKKDVAESSPVDAEITTATTESSPVNVEITTATTENSPPPETEKDDNSTKINQVLLSEMGMSGQNLTEKYPTSAENDAELITENNIVYTLGTGEYENFGVVEIKDIPFSTFFPEETAGVSVETLPGKYNLKYISEYFNEMRGVEISMFYTDGYTISVIGTQDGIVTETATIEIKDNNYQTMSNYNVPESDMQTSNITVFPAANTYGVPAEMTVSEFLNDPVIADISEKISQELYILKDNMAVESGVIDTDMIVAIKDIPLDSQVVWKVINWEE